MADGWKVVSLGEVVTKVEEQERDPVGAGFERFLKVEHLDADSLRIHRWGTIGDEELPPTFYKVFRRGQVLYPTRNPHLRRAAFADFDGICGEKTLTLQPVAEVIYPDLLPFVFQTERFLEHANGARIGSTNPHVRWRDVAAFKLALPPLEEQGRIAELLWAADNSIETYKTAAVEAEISRRRMLAQRLHGGLRVSSSQTDEPCPLPKGWRLVPVQELGEVKLGRQRAPKYQSGSWSRPYLRVANVFDGYLDLSDVLTMDFDESDFETYRLAPGDILLNEGQSRELVGRSCIYRGEIEECCFQNTLVRFRASDRVMPEYAHACFQHALYAGTFAKIARQTTSIAHLGAERFAAMQMPLPSLPEQQNITETLTAMWGAKSQLENHIQRLRSTKQALLRSLIGHEA